MVGVQGSFIRLVDVGVCHGIVSVCRQVHRKCESRIVRLDKVSYLCTIILNYLNYGTRQETIKQQTKVCRGCNR